MDIADAHSILGITAETPPEEVRRAYLRLTRKHNPEVDPQGFARVREAYDLLRSISDVRVAAPISNLGRAPAGAPTGAAAGSREADAGIPDAALFQQVLARLRAMPSLAALARADVVDRACREHPTSAPLFWLAVEEMAPFPTVHDRLRATLRRAADHDVPGALEHLTFFGPRLARDDERARLLGSDEPLERLLGARLLIATGDGAGAARVAAEVLASSTTRAVPAGALIDLALAALAAGQVPTAAAIRGALAGHFATYHDEAAVLRPELAVLWGVVDELLAMAPTFPGSAILCIARVVRGEGADSPYDVGRTLLALPDMPQDKKMMQLLAARAPMVFQMLSMEVVFANYGRHARRTPPRDIAIAAAVLFVIVAVRLQCLSDGCDRAPDRTSDTTRIPNLPPLEGVGTSMRPLRLLLIQACGTAPAPGQREECSQMTDVLDRLTKGRCDPALMTPKLDLGYSPELAQFLRLAATQASNLCFKGAGAGAGEAAPGP